MKKRERKERQREDTFRYLKTNGRHKREEN